jgi:hypothetical protein
MNDAAKDHPQSGGEAADGAGNIGYVRPNEFTERAERRGATRDSIALIAGRR